MLFKKENSALKNIFYYSILALSIFFLFNAYIYKDNRYDFSVIQKTTANSIITALESKVELPLLVADKQTIETELRKIDLSSQVVSIEIYDNEEVLVAKRVNEKLKGSPINPDVIKKELISQPKTTDYDDILIDDNQFIEATNIGAINVSMQSFEFANEFISNDLTLYFNLLLTFILLAVGVFFYWQSKVKYSQLDEIAKFLTTSKISYKAPSEFNRHPDLYRSAALAVDKIGKQNLQLANLQQEIQYAREDSNLELHQFLDFLINSGRVKFDKDLQTFIDSVLDKKSKELDLVVVAKEIRATIAKNSEVMSKNNVLVFDNILGKLEEYSVFIDESLFARFLKLFFKELITLCKNSTIHINADLNNVHDESHILRLSFESNSPAFKHALEQQNLFDFLPIAEVTVNTNNPTFIACKHLVHKVGGDYIFLENEIRFEFPVNIEKNYVSNASLSKIKPLNFKRSLLVFDSDPTERIVLMGYLDKFGQEIDKATTKQVVLQKLRRNQYDILCVNSDFFSEEDPYFMTNFRTEYSANEKPPLLLVISSNITIEDNKHFKAFNAKLLTKPIDLRALKNLLKKLS